MSSTVGVFEVITLIVNVIFYLQIVRSSLFFHQVLTQTRLKDLLLSLIFVF